MLVFRMSAISLIVVILCLTDVYAVDIFIRPAKVQVYCPKSKQHIFMDRVVKTDQQWKDILPVEVYGVTRKKGTELPYAGKYWTNHEEGTYVCACCRIALFSSHVQFDNGSGWASFYEPIANTNVILKKDRSLDTHRTEVLCHRCEAHLGYLFHDGPTPTRKRFCINSTALDFEKKDQ